MQQAIESYKEADPVARQRFVEAARRYIDHLLGHMDKEDAILLRLAGEIVDDRDKAALSEGFKRAEEELGAGGWEKYDVMASALERDWAV
jgi:hemerythrin-like domain-containing protein